MDGVTKLLLAFTGLLTLMIGAVIYVVLFAYPDPVGPAPAGATGPAPAEEGLACDASSLEGAVCPNNYYCRFDTCVPVEQEKICQEGDRCLECKCGEGLVCHQMRCVDVTKVDRTPMICAKDKRLADAVKQLGIKCAGRKKDVDDIISSGSCSAKDWEQLALEDDKFDLLLAAFPHRFAIHFQVGKPPLRANDWPTKAIREHYMQEIRRFYEPLFEAKQIFVIGRASPDGTFQANYDLSMRRMSFVSQLIESVIHEGKTETEKDKHRVRIRSFTLPTAEPIQPERYRSTYLKDPAGAAELELQPLVTWDDRSLADLQRALDDHALLGSKGSRAWQELYGAINRVVLVIPIPCMGDEYTPVVQDLNLPKEVSG